MLTGHQWVPTSEAFEPKPCPDPHPCPWLWFESKLAASSSAEVSSWQCLEDLEKLTRLGKGGGEAFSPLGPHPDWSQVSRAGWGRGLQAGSQAGACGAWGNGSRGGGWPHLGKEAFSGLHFNFTGGECMAFGDKEQERFLGC